MDNQILKKRLSTFRNDKGRLVRVSDELLIDVLRAWETWTGSSKEFYTELGVSKQTLGCFIKKAKKLNREGRFSDSSEFKEIQIESGSVHSISGSPCGIELSWNEGKVIRFAQVEQLVDFLKKVA